MMEDSPKRERIRTLSPQTKKKKYGSYDRHIMKIDRTRYELSPSSQSDQSTSSYQSSLQSTIRHKQSLKQFTLQLSQLATIHTTVFIDYWSGTTESVELRMLKCSFLKIFRIHGWKDNYYTNLVDWSYNNFICAANIHDLYFYNMAIDDELQSSLYRRYRLYDCEQVINSIKFSPRTTRIGLGYSKGILKCYDYFKQKITIKRHNYHSGRITALEWQGNVILTGSKDRCLKSIDTSTSKECMIFPRYHNQQICSVKSNGTLLASGGNDNTVCIFDLRRTDKLLDHYKHDAAIKALDWMMPNTLVSGGGTADRKIKKWKDGQGVFASIDTGSQICGLKVSINTDQLVTCQGFSLNQIIIWNSSGKRELTIHGHTKRVLYCAMSPSGEHIATGAGDQELKVWKLFRKKSYSREQLGVIR